MHARRKLGTGAKRRYLARKVNPKGYPSYVRYSRPYVPRTPGGIIVSESRYFDSRLNGTVLNEGNSWADTELDPATLNTIFAPTQGNDINSRQGRQVSVYKIALRGFIRASLLQDQADVLAAPLVRLILYIDTQTNAAQAQGENVMQAPQDGSPEMTSLTFQNTANFGRFRILRDKIIRPRDMSVGTDGASTMSECSADVPFKMMVRFKKPIVVHFNSTNGGTVADIIDNSFHLIGCKNSAVQATAIYYAARTYYKDG